MVEARRNADKVEECHDLFSGLLDAAQDEPDNGAAISEEELIGKYECLPVLHRWKTPLTAIPGNMFIVLLAGHDVGPSPSSCTIT